MYKYIPNRDTSLLQAVGLKCITLIQSRVSLSVCVCVCVCVCVPSFRIEYLTITLLFSFIQRLRGQAESLHILAKVNKTAFEFIFTNLVSRG